MKILIGQWAQTNFGLLGTICVVVGLFRSFHTSLKVKTEGANYIVVGLFRTSHTFLMVMMRSLLKDT